MRPRCSARLAVLVATRSHADGTAWLEQYQPVAQQIIAESQSSDFAWQRLAELTDTFGHRLSGSETLEQAIDWAVAAMKNDGLENVRKEPVMVPKWVRGRESLELVQPVRQPLADARTRQLGRHAGRRPRSRRRRRQELRRSRPRAADVKGKIVLFNVPFTNYGADASRIARDGPSRAAKLGAVAMLVRSVGPTGLRTPHTGATVYADDAPKIPAAAIPAEDADRFQRLAGSRRPQSA